MKFRQGLSALMLSLMAGVSAHAQDAAPADAAASAPAEATAAPAEATPAPAAEAAPAEATPAPAAAEATPAAAPIEMAPAEATPTDATASGGDWWSTQALVGHPYYIAPMFSYTNADKDRGTENGIGGTIAAGKMLTDGFAMEAKVQYSMLDAKTGGGSAKATGIGLNALVFPLSTLPNAYGLLGLSYNRTSDHPGPVSSYNSTMFDAGIGYLYPITQNILLRGEALYRMDNHGKNNAGVHTGDKSAFYDGIFNIGVLIPFGAETAAAAAPAETAVVEPAAAPADGDDDNDGVPNSADKCPNTPAGTKVNADGCPLDSDGDGVLDGVDECPHTPAGAKVLPNGCALVGDCRTPRPGEAVDANGCAAQTFVLKGVNFDFDSSRLTDDSKNILNSVSDTLKEYSQVKVEVDGHTDDQGTEAYNMKLSERRAKSVKGYLVERGVDGGRMDTKGFGKTQPIAPGTSEEARAQNRRVELKAEQP